MRCVAQGCQSVLTSTCIRHLVTHRSHMESSGVTLNALLSVCINQKSQLILTHSFKGHPNLNKCQSIINVEFFSWYREREGWRNALGCFPAVSRIKTLKFRQISTQQVLLSALDVAIDFLSSSGMTPWLFLLR